MLKHNRGLPALPLIEGLAVAAFLLVAIPIVASSPTTCVLQLADPNGKSPWTEGKFIAPRGYVCYRAETAIAIDGKLDELAWEATPWTENFVDIEGDMKPKPRFRTRAKMLWDDQYFYIAAELEEPHVWATLTEHDSVIFQDNDFEVFIDPDGDNHNYGEFEMNAINTGWDLLLRKPYKDGGPAENSWEIPGLKTAVHVNGTLNDPSDTDHGWTLEIAMPWAVLSKLIGVAGVESSSPQPERRDEKAGGSKTRPQPPSDGDQWRVNFSRVEWQIEIVDGKYRKVPNRPEDNWVWSPQWTINMHRPETWGTIQFSTAVAGTGDAHAVKFRPDTAGPAKHLLCRGYYAQQAFRKQHDRFANSLDELGLTDLKHESLARPLTMEAGGSRFILTAAVRQPDGTIERWQIREDSRIWRE